MINSQRTVRLFFLSLLFFTGCPPDEKEKIVFSPIHVEWVRITSTPNTNRMFRTKVPQGWILSSTSYAGEGLIFIPDDTHKWLSEPEKDPK